MNRDDNDYQVILRYDICDWSKFETPLNQKNMHRNGPVSPDSKYFVYTGNTAWGVQNLEYDSSTGYMFMAVYCGKKEKFPNFPMYAVDMKKGAIKEEHRALNENVVTLTLAEIGKKDDKSGVWGMSFPYGSTGMISLGDGYFYFSQPFGNGKEIPYGTDVVLYQYDGEDFYSV